MQDKRFIFSPTICPSLSLSLSSSVSSHYPGCQVKTNQISFIADDKRKTRRSQLTQPQLRPITWRGLLKI